MRLALIALLLAAPAFAEPEEAVLRGGTGPGNSFCTAVLVGPNILLTAAHCTRQGPGRWAHEWIDGRARTVVSGYEVTPVTGPDGPTGTQLHADQALVTLPRAPRDTAPIPLGAPPVRGESVRILAYPRDARAITDTACTVTEVRATERLLDCEVSTGMSGAPVLANRGGQWQLTALLVARRNADDLGVATILPSALFSPLSMGQEVPDD